MFFFYWSLSSFFVDEFPNVIASSIIGFLHFHLRIPSNGASLCPVISLVYLIRFWFIQFLHAFHSFLFCIYSFHLQFPIPCTIHFYHTFFNILIMLKFRGIPSFFPLVFLRLISFIDVTEAFLNLFPFKFKF